MHVMSVKPGMSHLPWPSMRRAPAGSLAGVPAVIDAIRPFSSVTVARTGYGRFSENRGNCFVTSAWRT